jgi:predicted nucleotidyltransferase
MVQSFDDAASAIREVLGRHPEILRASIFGSFVRGEQTKSSDIDILVEFDKPVGFKFFGIADEVEKAVGRKIDLLTPYALQMVDYGPSIQKGAVVVYEKGQPTA